jgi:hypothetical protein
MGPLENRFREQARSHRKQEQDQKIAAFGSSTMSVSSSAFDLDPPATSEG